MTTEHEAVADALKDNRAYEAAKEARQEQERTAESRRGAAMTGRPPRIPERGDVPKAVVAQRLGLTVAEFDSCRMELEKRDFPEPDKTTGRYCIEAVDRWRLRRHSRLFPELTSAVGAVDACAVVEERLAAMRREAS
jgi:hypothetical protein